MDSRRLRPILIATIKSKRGWGPEALIAHSLSTTSRCVLFFVHDSGIKLDEVIGRLFSGEHVKEPSSTMNPSKMVRCWR